MIKLWVGVTLGFDSHTQLVPLKGYTDINTVLHHSFSQVLEVNKTFILSITEFLKSTKVFLFIIENDTSTTKKINEWQVS